MQIESESVPVRLIADGAIKIPKPSTRSKKENQMSTNEKTEATNVEAVSRTFKYFDLKTCEKKSVEVKWSFTPAASYQDAVGRLGSDATVILNALNDALRRQSANIERGKVLELGIPYSVVMDFIKAFRLVPDKAAIVSLEKGQDGWKSQYDTQTKVILAEISQEAFLMKQLRAIAANATITDDDE